MKRSPPPALDFLQDELDALRARHLLRHPPPIAREQVSRSFCSNDYLGLSSRPVTELAGMNAGAGASRLVIGEHAAHRALERTLVDWLEVEAALVFTSGYAANLGTVSALARAGDLIVSDALNHASLIDGARLSRAEVVVVPHADVNAVAEALARAGGRRTWVITESYFSMDGDTPDLVRLREISQAAGAALIVDEAHALGLFGPDGRGVCAERGVTPDVLLGTFGKCFGAGGAFAAGCTALVDWLWNRARSFVFSTGLSPLVAESARLGIERARAEPALRSRALQRAQELRSGLRELGVLAPGSGPIVPIVLGSAERTVRVAARLREEGIVVQPIRPPTVPEGGARLRLTVTAAHAHADVRRLLDALRRALA